MAKKYDHLVKLMLIGDSGVGKTAILVRFVDNEFTPSFMTTIGETKLLFYIVDDFKRFIFYNFVVFNVTMKYFNRFD